MNKILIDAFGFGDAEDLLAAITCLRGVAAGVNRTVSRYTAPVVHVSSPDGFHVNGAAKLYEVTLTDGSKVYNIELVEA